MRIAFVTFEYPPHVTGGAGTYAKNIAQELARQGHEITVFTPGPTGERPPGAAVEARGIRTSRRLPFKSLQFWVRVSKEIERLHASKKFDIVHVNGLSYWFLKKKIIDVPHVVTIHHLATDVIKNNGQSLFSALTDLRSEGNLMLKAIEKRCVTSADVILTDSRFTKRRITEVYDVDQGKIEVVYIGIDLKAVAASPEEIKKFKRSLDLPEKPVVLFVGRVDDTRKGLDLLLLAFQKVSAEAGASLLVVGAGSARNARKMIEALKVPDVRFLGHVDEPTLQRCYAICDVYVCPSRLEGFGLTLVEAMAFGKPIVAVNAGSVGEVLNGYDRHILVDPASPVDGLYRGLTGLLDGKAEPRAGGQKWPGADFSWDSAGRKTTGAYKKVIRGERHHEKS